MNPEFIAAIPWMFLAAVTFGALVALGDHLFRAIYQAPHGRRK